MKPLFVRAWLLFILACVVSLTIKGCSLLGSPEGKPFRVGLNSWPGYQVALYGKAAGLFRKHGLDVEFVRFTNQQDNIRATMRGALDASFVPLSEVMQSDPNQEQPVFVLVADISAGSDGIAAGPTIRSVKDLKGKKVSAKLSTVSHLILLEALKANQLAPYDVEVVDVANERGVNLLKQNKISAATLWEPFLADTAKAVGGKVIFTTADVDSVVIDGLATRSGIAQARQDELVNFLKAWFEIMAAVDSKPQEVFAAVAKEVGTTVENFAIDYSGLKKGDVAMNRRMFVDGRLKAAAQQIRELLSTDLRHGRVIRDDVDINVTPLIKATNNWE